MSQVEVYLSKTTSTQQEEYKRIRAIAVELLPEFEETISYGMPTIKYKGKVVFHFGAFKNHMSLFPGSGSVYNQMGDELKHFRVSKGTLQFSADNPISDDLVKKIIQVRISDLDTN